MPLYDSILLLLGKMYRYINDFYCFIMIIVVFAVTLFLLYI